MKHINKFNENRTNNGDFREKPYYSQDSIDEESILIPISTLRDWINRLDMAEYDLNHKIYVKDDIEKLVSDSEK